jgi:PAS domain S-box-containing protein
VIVVSDHQDAPNPSDDAYRRLFESHPVAMAVWDPATGRILAANDAALAQYGYDHDEIVGIGVEALVHPDDMARLRARVPRLPEGYAGVEPYRHLRRDGSVIEVEMSGHPIEWAGRPARLVVAADVTARRRLEEQLRAARALEAVGRLAGGIAHDFNNLLMAINGFSQLLLDRLPEGSDEREAADQIRTAGERAAALTGQLLAFARPSEPDPARIDLNTLIQAIGPTLRGVVGPNVEVEIRPRAVRPVVVADRAQIEQVVVGCAINARDAMPDGGTLRIETTDVSAMEARALAGTLGDAPQVSLSISDSGGRERRGGAPFDGAPANRATGLGLALVYSTVQQAGGRIRLESTPGRGSTVRIFLTAADPEPEPVRVLDRLGALGDASGTDAPPIDGAAEEAVHGDGSHTSARIVVIEDEPGVRNLVELILRRAGHDVRSFSEGATALDALADSTATIDLLVTDIVMPGPSGIEVARRLRRERPELPVLLMSGFAADTLKAEGVDEASVDVLAKPFSAGDLMARVQAVLDEAQSTAR